MKTLQELQEIRERMQKQLGTRQAAETGDTRIVVGMATCGIAAGARPVLSRLADEVVSRKLNGVAVVQTGCIGMCRLEPIVEVYEPGKEKVTYVKVTPEMASRIVTDHIVNGNPVADYMVME